MVIMDIAGWVANLLVLGIAFVIWGIGIFIMALLLTTAKRFVKDLIN